MNSYKNHCIFQALIGSIQEFRGFQSAKGWPIHFPSDFSEIGVFPILSRGLLTFQSMEKVHQDLKRPWIEILEQGHQDQRNDDDEGPEQRP